MTYFVYMLALLRKHKRQEKTCGHKMNHNSSSRPPIDIKNNALDKIFHAWLAANSFECGNLQNKAVLKQFNQF